MSLVRMQHGQLRLVRALSVQKWMKKAECYLRKMDPNLFFADPVPPEVIDACNACIVKKECLKYSYQAEDPRLKAGIWGGYTPRQRTNIEKGVNVQRFTSAKKLAKDRAKKGGHYYQSKRKNAEANS